MLFPKISSLLHNFTDHHSHILPGVDDGVKKMEVSLKVLERYEQLGIAEVWCTPHIMEDIPNTTAGLQARFAELCEAYQGPIKLHLAAEYWKPATCSRTGTTATRSWWRPPISHPPWTWTRFYFASSRRGIIQCWPIPNAMFTWVMNVIRI